MKRRAARKGQRRAREADADGGAKRITDALLRKWPLPALDEKLGKKGRGTVLVVGGSREVPGAVMLAAIGALRAGAGTLQIATSRSVARALAIAVPEARVVGLSETRRGELAPGCCRTIGKDADACDALLVGPGMRDATAGLELLKRSIASKAEAALIVDAGALDLFAKKKRVGPALPKRTRIIATPHAGEMAKLWGIDVTDVLGNPAEMARAAAATLGVIVALKGADTYVAAPDGSLFCNTAGNVGLGTSGSGDTLSGVIAGLCARGADPLQATVWGVYLHAKAGEVLGRKTGPLGFLARELLTEIPPLLAALT
jgi:hydroxyethylthiazole kinase-like uncharacterized protein yjeF